MNKIDITVETFFIKEQSRVEDNFYVFAYCITITNNGDIPAQLLRRHWIIKDFNNKVLEVEGEGVIGEQPRIEPGKQFVYTSGTHLDTDVGTMKGTYTMKNDDGEEFEAIIGEFVLSAPQSQAH